MRAIRPDLLRKDAQLHQVPDRVTNALWVHRPETPALLSLLKHPSEPANLVINIAAATAEVQPILLFEAVKLFKRRAEFSVG